MRQARTQQRSLPVSSAALCGVAGSLVQEREAPLGVGVEISCRLNSDVASSSLASALGCDQRAGIALLQDVQRGRVWLNGSVDMNMIN